MPLVTLNGCRHFYEDIGGGEPVVLLHGNQNSSRYFARLIPDLATDFRVIAPHLRGMGLSEHVTELPPSAWVDDTLALLDLLGVDRAHFYGVSLGSLIAMRSALECPDRMLTLSVDAPIIAIDPTPPPEPAQPRREPPPEVADELRAMHGDDWQSVMENCDRFMRDPALRASFSLGEAVAAIGVPVLIIRGDIEEAVHPLMHAVELHQLLPDSWLWISPHSRSLLTRRHPADTARVFRNFVSEAAGMVHGGGDPTQRDHTELLARVELFAGLDRGTLIRLASLVRARTPRTGELVFRQGDPGDGLYVVIRGSFSAAITTPDDHVAVPLRSMGPGEYFGEMALLTNEPRSATVLCEEDGELLHIPQLHFRALLQRDAAVATAVATTLSRRMRAHDEALVERARADLARGVSPPNPANVGPPCDGLPQSVAGAS